MHDKESVEPHTDSELLRLAQEVKHRKRPRVFRHAGEDVAILMPIIPEGKTLGGILKENTASLLVSGNDLEPDEISRLLGHSPTGAYRKGEERRGGYAPAETGLWYLDSPLQGDQEADDRIGALLDAVTDDPTVWSQLHERYSSCIFVGWFVSSDNQVSYLSWELLERLAKRKLLISFDVYCTQEA
jgi:hypothetical protein